MCCCLQVCAPFAYTHHTYTQAPIIPIYIENVWNWKDDKTTFFFGNGGRRVNGREWEFLPRFKLCFIGFNFFPFSLSSSSSIFLDTCFVLNQIKMELLHGEIILLLNVEKNVRTRNTVCFRDSRRYLPLASLFVYLFICSFVRFFSAAAVAAGSSYFNSPNGLKNNIQADILQYINVWMSVCAFVCSC